MATKASRIALAGSNISSTGEVDADLLDNIDSAAFLSLDSNGRLGIGTASPSTKLTVKNNNSSTSFGDNNLITLQNLNTTDNSRMGLAFTGNTNIGSGLAIIEAVSYDQSQGHTSLNFSVYNGSWHNDMMVLKAGNVGIGTNTPAKKLDVDGDFYVRDSHHMHMGTVNTGLWALTNGTGGINMRGGTTGTYAAIAESASTGYSNIYLNKINVTSDISENANRFIDFYYDGVSGVRVRGNSSKDLSFDMHGGGNFLLPSGNVGIGTSSPSVKLDVQEAAAGATIKLTESSDAGSNPAAFIGYRSRGTSLSSPTAIQAGNYMTQFAMGAHDGTSYSVGAKTMAVATENWSSSSHGTSMGMYTTSNGSTTPQLRLNIDSSGVVTTPGQPAFSVRRNSVSSASSHSVVDFDTVNYNIGSHYNIATNYFTAPVSGVYSFTAHVIPYGLAQNTAFELWIAHNATSVRIFLDRQKKTESDTNTFSVGGSASIYMSANDFVYLVTTYASYQDESNCWFTGQLSG